MLHEEHSRHGAPATPCGSRGAGQEHGSPAREQSRSAWVGSNPGKCGGGVSGWVGPVTWNWTLNRVEDTARSFLPQMPVESMKNYQAPSGASLFAFTPSPQT